MGRQIIRFDKYAESLAVLNSRFGDSNAVHSNALKSALKKAVAGELSEKQRQTLLMYYFERRTVSQIARALGVNKSTVSRSLKSARVRLGKILNYGFFT